MDVKVQTLLQSISTPEEPMTSAPFIKLINDIQTITKDTKEGTFTQALTKLFHKAHRDPSRIVFTKQELENPNQGEDNQRQRQGDNQQGRNHNRNRNNWNNNNNNNNNNYNNNNKNNNNNNKSAVQNNRPNPECALPSHMKIMDIIRPKGRQANDNPTYHGTTVCLMLIMTGTCQNGNNCPFVHTDPRDRMENRMDEFGKHKFSQE
jgi:hypothetical protein